MAAEVRATSAGIILEVMVEPGTRVEADDELIVIEAMKMQSLIYAPCDGTVKTVRVQPGDIVDADAVMIIIE